MTPGVRAISRRHKYQAFISYAHKDEVIAARLHKALETYKVPKKLPIETSKKLSPIFRDTAELTAHHSLSEKIQEAVKQSRYLIVLCSPSAKNSLWVNEEIRLFRKLHGEASILCGLVKGTPEQSFPPALLEEGREPLAADLSKDNFRLGTTQFAASMLGVGLDDLIQRELKRIRRRVMAVTAGAAGAILVMGSLTWLAMDARSQAEKRTHDAEGQIEFMLTDLKDKLEEVGRLDILQDVGDRAFDYYDGYPLSDHDDDALGRRARVFHQLGKLQDQLGNLEDASQYFTKAFVATENLLSRESENGNRVYEHAQSAYWVAFYQYRLKEYADAKLYFQTYLDLARQLEALEGNSDRAQAELGYAFTNLGLMSLKLGKTTEAQAYYQHATDYKEKRFKASPKDRKRLMSLANAYGHVATLNLKEGNLSKALSNWTRADTYISEFMDPTDKSADLLYRRVTYQQALARLELLNSDIVQASVHLNEGQKLANHLLEIDPTNVDVRYEALLLDTLIFEVALLKDEDETAKDIQKSATAKMAHFPESFRKSANYGVLQSRVSNLPIYLALKKNTGEARLLAKELSKRLQASSIDSAQDVIEHSYELPTILLVNLILSDPHTNSILNELCVLQDSLNLDFQTRILLATYFANAQCSAAHPPPPKSLMSEAIKWHEN